ncbi:thioesterase II family protein [Streptomyces sp. NPDC088755]|uniref:thioesterase II family protein n=1 Tax=Streptomyces sp. NPDC088755 TaxID=3365888 RepID=UPI0038267918
MTEAAQDAASSSTPSEVGWVRRYHPAPGADRRLVCFPHAGGSASYYFPVSRAIGPYADVLAIQYPGRHDRHGEACLDSIGGLADALEGELPAWFDRPVTFFGHSMGALLAFEVARRLERRGIVLHGLCVSGRRAPSRPRSERVHLGGDEALLAHMARLSGTDSRVLGDPELMRLVMPAVRADYKAVETYAYTDGPPLSCPVLALTGDDDPQVTLEEAGAWAEHTGGGFALKVFPGGHFYLNTCADAVTAAVRGHLG